MLDTIDRKLLASLQECNRASLDRLAETVGSSRSAVARRLRRLRVEGIIRRDIAVLDQRRLGTFETFMIRMDLSRKNGPMVSAFFALMNELPQVQQCYLTTGAMNCVLIVIVQDTNELEGFVEAHLIDNPLIHEFTTALVTRSVKVGLGLPITAPHVNAQQTSASSPVRDEL